MVFRGFEVQGHHLIALSGVLDGSFIGGFNSGFISATMKAIGPVSGLGPDLNTLLSINAFDFNA